MAAALVLLVAAVIWLQRGSSPAGGADTAYVTSVAELTGQFASTGVFNRFSGVVEPQETRSYNKRDDAEIDEIFVETGDTVSVGTPLFSYSKEKYEEDLAKAEIDLERLKNELDSISTTIGQLEKDRKAASSSDKANYTVQIQEQELNYRQQEYDIQSKELEIEKFKDNIRHSTVSSDIDGVVKSINKENTPQSYYGGETENGFIVVMKTGGFRVKGSVNEQNIYDISEDMPVIVHSRRDRTQTWKGVITSIDRENTQSSENMYGEGAGSSSYPFYVNLESGDGLLIGQHVYLEIDYGTGTEGREGLWLDEFMIEGAGTEDACVWADNGKGRLERRKVTLGEYDSELMQYQVLEGLSAEDYIAFPDGTLTEGMACSRSEMTDPGMTDPEMTDSEMMDPEMTDPEMMEEDDD